MGSHRISNNRQTEERRVARAIKAALIRIEERDPLLGRKLRERIKTGQVLSYIPKPGG